MDSLFLELSSAVIAEYWKNADAHMLDEMIGARFFPAKRTQKLELEWIKGVNGLPIAIQPSAYDADPSLRDRIGFNSIRTEIPFFREAIKLGEKERREYIAAKAQGNDFVVLTENCVEKNCAVFAKLTAKTAVITEVGVDCMLVVLFAAYGACGAGKTAGIAAVTFVGNFE